MNEPIDPTVLALSRAIRKAEGGDYNNYGGDASTSAGAYQWNNGKIALKKGEIPLNFQSDAKQFGLDPNDFSQTNQDHVAYEKIKSDLKSGLTQSQIAAKWNSGLTQGWENHKGSTTINGKTIFYDTPAYVDKVKSYYQEFASSPSSKTDANGYITTTTPAPVQKQEQNALASSDPSFGQQMSSDSLGGQLSGRINDASQAVTDFTSGKQGLISTGIQAVGAVAGGIGDIVNKGIEMIPGVKAIEGVIGSGISTLAKTPTGQAVVKSLQDFSTQHPELSKDIGAGFNILTAIPILRGLGVVKDVTLDAASLALKKTAEKVGTNGLNDLISSTVTGRKALAANPNATKTLITERALPDIVNDRYSTEGAFNQLKEQITHIEDSELQPTLAKVSTTAVKDRIPLENLHKEAIDLISQEMKGRSDSNLARSEVDRAFESFKHDYGDYVTLQDVNDMKRGIRETVNFNSPKLLGDTTYHLGQIFQKFIENEATKLGLGNVNAINKKMARLIKAQNMLQHIEGKQVRTKLVGGMIKDAATAAGEMAGNATGIPLAGAYVGREIGGRIGKKLSGVTKGILDRTGKNKITRSAITSTKKVSGLIAGTEAQKINR